MIIKTLTRSAKSGSSGQLLNYIFKYTFDDEKKIKGEETNQLIISHNIRGAASIDNLVKQFKRNEEQRIHKRKDQTVVHHTIVSFSPKSSPFITKEKLQAIANKFIELRGQNLLIAGTTHLDKNHVHLHLAVSNQLNGLSSRLSKKEFEDLKFEMNEFQKEKFPELNDSLTPTHLFHSKIQTPELLLKTFAKQRATQKEAIAIALKTAYSQAISGNHFLELLSAYNLSPYYRNGMFAGVVDQTETKYRLSKFGYEFQSLEDLDHSLLVNAELNSVKQLRQRSEEKVMAITSHIDNKNKFNERLKALNIKGHGEHSPISITRELYESPGGDANLQI